MTHPNELQARAWDSGCFRDWGRAAHWALQDACCPCPHHVIPVLTDRAVQQSTGGAT